MIKYYYGPVNSDKAHRAMTDILSSGSNFTYVKATENGYVPNSILSGLKDIIIANAHFLTEDYIKGICTWAEENNVNVYFIGLVFNKNKEKYPSHITLLKLADECLETEIKCNCGEKAIYNISIGTDGEAILHTDIRDTKVIYKAVCPYCYEKLQAEARLKDERMLAMDTFIECFN